MVGYSYQILIDGVLQHEVINKNPRVFEHVNLYAGNVNHKAQKGEIKDLEYSGGVSVSIIYHKLKYQIIFDFSRRFINVRVKF